MPFLSKLLQIGGILTFLLLGHTSSLFCKIIWSESRWSLLCSWMSQMKIYILTITWHSLMSTTSLMCDVNELSAHRKCYIGNLHFLSYNSLWSLPYNFSCNPFTAHYKTYQYITLFFIWPASGVRLCLWPNAKIQLDTPGLATKWGILQFCTSQRVVPYIRIGFG